MRIGNVAPPKGFLKKLGERAGDSSFTDCAVSWPEDVLEIINQHNLKETDAMDGYLIGGKMETPVRQHIDSVGADLSVVWFPKVYGGIVFVCGSKCEGYTVISGDVFVFDHKEPHSVCAGIEQNRESTGVYYFMTQCFNRGGNDEHSSKE